MNIAPAHAPGISAPWMVAFESLVEAQTTIKRITDTNSPIVRDHGFLVDRALLGHSTPYMWSKETIAATLSAARSVPMDAEFSQWNFDTAAAWWWFEEPLPYYTILEPHPMAVRALSFGWLSIDGKLSIGCSSWCDEDYSDPRCSLRRTITPSQTWIWQDSKTLGGMLANTRVAHEEVYGPGDRHQHQPNIGPDKFIEAAEGLSRFILAGMAWLSQRVLVEASGHVERHRRKDWERRTKRPMDGGVRVVSLRKLDRPLNEDPAAHGKVDWACRWTVGGHFRNQACGVKHGDRKLTWIHPYIKGPDDKPLATPKIKVYAVNR